MLAVCEFQKNNIPLWANSKNLLNTYHNEEIFISTVDVAAVRVGMGKDFVNDYHKRMWH